jgi:hypothetical protein
MAPTKSSSSVQQLASSNPIPMERKSSNSFPADRLRSIQLLAATNATSAGRIQKTPSKSSDARLNPINHVAGQPKEQNLPKPVSRQFAAAHMTAPGRSGYGDGHARREHQLMLEFQKAASKVGSIDEETLAQMVKPWQEKGVLEMVWRKEDLLGEKDGVVAEEVMDLKKAEAIARKKDAEEKALIERYLIGEVDADGKVIRGDSAQDSADSSESSISSSPTPKTKEAEPKKVAFQKVSTGRITKKSPTTSSPPRPTSASSSLSSSSKFEKVLSKTLANNPITIEPLPGLPDYKAYDYFDLVALCQQRNLVSGGDIHIIRARLVHDDINVINDLPREAKSYAKEKTRPRARAAPVVPNAPVAPAAPTIKRKQIQLRGRDLIAMKTQQQKE